MSKKEVMTIINTYQNYYNEFINVSNEDLNIIFNRAKRTLDKINYE